MFRHVPSEKKQALDERLRAKDTEARCGLMVVDLESGNIAHWLEISGVVAELYDVQVLPGVVRPMALGFKTDEICRILTIEDKDTLRLEAMAGVRQDSQPLDFMTMRQGGAVETAPAPPPAERVEIPVADQPAVAVHTIDNTAYRFQVSVNMTVAAARQSYGHLLFPDLHAREHGRPIHEPLITTVALYRDQVVGMALAAEDPVHGLAEILSLYLMPEHCGRRLSYGLVRHLARTLAERGCTSMRLVYHADWPSLPVIERMLAGLGWTIVQPHRVRVRGEIRALVQAPWVQEHTLPDGFSLAGWEDLSAAERERVGKVAQPGDLVPFRQEGTAEPSGWWLRCGEEVVGWLITRRRPDAVEVAALHLPSELRGGEVEVGFLAEVVKGCRQEIPYWVAWYDADDQATAQLVARYLQPYLFSQVELRTANRAL